MIKILRLNKTHVLVCVDNFLGFLTQLCLLTPLSASYIFILSVQVLLTSL